MQGDVGYHLQYSHVSTERVLIKFFMLYSMVKNGRNKGKNFGYNFLPFFLLLYFFITLPHKKGFPYTTVGGQLIITVIAAIKQ